MPNLDKDTVNRDLSKIQQIASQFGIEDINNIDPQTRQALIERLEKQLGGQRQRQLGSTIQEVGGIWSQDRGYTFDPQTGRVSAVETGVTAPAKPSGISELIALEKFRLTQEIEREKAEERKVKLEKTRLELGRAQKEAERQEELEERFREQERPPERMPTAPLTAPLTAVPTAVPTAPPTEVPTAPPTPPMIPTALPPEAGKPSAGILPPQFRTTIERDAQGRLVEKREETPEFKVFQKGQQKLMTDRAASIGKLAVGMRISFTNLEKVAGAISDLDRVFAAGHERGEMGAGVASQARFSAAKAIGGRTQDQFINASKMPGKKAEVLFNMIPMLTQQGEKPGSVRIMRSVLRLLGQTLPDIGTGLEAGKGMMAESIRSFYRFARAAELNKIEFDRQFAGRDLNTITDDELSGWIAKVNRAAERVRIKPEEEKALTGFIDNALKSSGDLVKKRGARPTTLEASAIDEELADIERQLGE